jgi:peptide deformylase
MAKLKIYVDPSPILRDKAREVDKFDPDTKKVINDMLDTLRSLPGYGLAAPQVGVSKRIVVIESTGVMDEDGNYKSDPIPLTILVNPVIVKFSKEKCDFEEGCFSVPEYRGEVTRPKKVKVVAQDRNGRKIQINASGLFARVLQHEIDHLDGILFIDLIDDKSKLIKNEIGPEWKEAIEG